MKKVVAPLAFGTIALVGLYACMTSSSGGSSAFALEWNEPVISLDQSNHVITTASTDYYCENTTAVAETDTEAANYGIVGGKLYLWDDGECNSAPFTGTSSTIIGTWTSTDFVEGPIPASIRPAGCSGTVSAGDTTGLGDISQIIQNPVATATISATNVHFKISGGFCFAPIYADIFSQDTSSFKVVSSDCQSVQLKVTGTSQVTTISSSFSNNSINVSVKYNGKTCTLNEPLPTPGAMPNCSVSQVSDSTFDACINSSGFYGSAKTAASGNASLGMSLSREISKATRHPHF